MNFVWSKSSLKFLSSINTIFASNSFSAMNWSLDNNSIYSVNLLCAKIIFRLIERENFKSGNSILHSESKILKYSISKYLNDKENKNKEWDDKK